MVAVLKHERCQDPIPIEAFGSQRHGVTDLLLEVAFDRFHRHRSHLAKERQLRIACRTRERCAFEQHEESE